MADRKVRRLLFILCGAASAAGLSVCAELGIERLGESRSRILRYESQLQRIRAAVRSENELSAMKADLEERKERIRARFYSPEEISPYSFASLVKKRLGSLGIVVARYQVSDLKGKAVVDFSVTGTPRALLQFLRDASREEKYWSVESFILTARQGSRIVDVAMRIGDEVVDAENR